MLKKMHENTILFEEYEVIKKANDELKVALIEIQQELQRKETNPGSGRWTAPIKLAAETQKRHRIAEWTYRLLQKADSRVKPATARLPV